jgi:hypothetical protein
VTRIQYHPATTGCDEIYLTYKTLFRIFDPRKSKFLSIEEIAEVIVAVAMNAGASFAHSCVSMETLKR